MLFSAEKIRARAWRWNCLDSNPGSTCAGCVDTGTLFNCWASVSSSKTWSSSWHHIQKLGLRVKGNSTPKAFSRAPGSWYALRQCWLLASPCTSSSQPPKMLSLEGMLANEAFSISLHVLRHERCERFCPSSPVHLPLTSHYLFAQSAMFYGLPS